MTYDSRKDTIDHIKVVQSMLGEVITHLEDRGKVHDKTKLEEPEKSVFDSATTKLREVEYNSPEYYAALAEMKPALDHHYLHNSHHPEHYPEGVDGMDLIDVIEMLCDWRAAGQRLKNGNIYDSIEKNQQRFGYTEEFKGLLKRTALTLGWEV